MWHHFQCNTDGDTDHQPKTYSNTRPFNDPQPNTDTCTHRHAHDDSNSLTVPHLHRQPHVDTH